VSSHNETLTQRRSNSTASMPCKLLLLTWFASSGVFATSVYSSVSRATWICSNGTESTIQGNGMHLVEVAPCESCRFLDASMSESEVGRSIYGMGTTIRISLADPAVDGWLRTNAGRFGFGAIGNDPSVYSFRP